MIHFCRLLMLIQSTLMATLTQAEEFNSTQKVNQTLVNFSKVNRPPVCDPSVSESNLEKCQEKMRRLYQDNTAHIDLFLGYLDSGGEPPVTADAVQRAYLVQKLYMTCGAEPCGFKADAKNADKLSKTLADGKRIQVNLHSSALTDRDDLNRKNPDQAVRTSKLNEKFKNALKNNEAVFYIGHSRDGGGPDFGPPRLLKNGHTDYDWYRKNRPGLKMIKENMRKSHPELYGSFSCDSLHHFAAPIRSVNPDVIYFGTKRLAYYNFTQKVVNNVVLPDRLLYSEVVDSALLAVGGIATRKCDFNKTFLQNKMPTEADYN